MSFGVVSKRLDQSTRASCCMTLRVDHRPAAADLRRMKVGSSGDPVGDSHRQSSGEPHGYCPSGTRPRQCPSVGTGAPGFTPNYLVTVASPWPSVGIGVHRWFHCLAWPAINEAAQGHGTTDAHRCTPMDRAARRSVGNPLNFEAWLTEIKQQADTKTCRLQVS